MFAGCKKWVSYCHNSLKIQVESWGQFSTVSSSSDINVKCECLASLARKYKYNVMLKMSLQWEYLLQ